jgi:ABC-type antimicrobial peptide transport system permease subunit
MIKDYKAGIGAIIVGVYSASLIFSFMACQNNTFPFNLVLPLSSGILGTLLVLFCGLDV